MDAAKRSSQPLSGPNQGTACPRPGRTGNRALADEADRGRALDVLDSAEDLGGKHGRRRGVLDGKGNPQVVRLLVRVADGKAVVLLATMLSELDLEAQ